MKSQLQDNIVRTSCKNCVLAKYEGNEQIDCLANRLDKVQKFEAYDDEKEFYVIERFCNYYRDNSSYIDNNQVDLEKIRFESQVSFDLIFLCDDINETMRKKICSFYLSIISKYDDKKIFPHLCYKKIYENQKACLMKIKEYMPLFKISYYRENSKFIHNLFMKSRNSYHLIVNENTLNDHNILYDINYLVNEDMKKAIVVERNNTLAISNLAYKVEAMKIISNDYDKIIDSVIEESKRMKLYHTL